MKTDDYLRRLREWEEVDYVPTPAREPALSGGLMGGPLSVVVIPTPRTEIMRNEATRLERQAAEIERRAVYINAIAPEEASTPVPGEPTTPVEPLAWYEGPGVTTSAPGHEQTARPVPYGVR